MIADLIASLGLAFGALIGLGSLISPSWAAGVVRLIADPAKPGGYSEFRATYGGLLFLTHGTALVLVLMLGGALGAFIAFPLAMGWFGAALGRGLSLLLDGEKLREAAMNPIWIATELAMALAIAAPMVHLL
ncbi:MAG: hypothetical protein MRY64_06600 [Hyphomonadaceae bacterium]|nr:hypothetical protein [Hyphomonadaceae bacterium]